MNAGFPRLALGHNPPVGTYYGIVVIGRPRHRRPAQVGPVGCRRSDRRFLRRLQRLRTGRRIIVVGQLHDIEEVEEYPSLGRRTGCEDEFRFGSNPPNRKTVTHPVVPRSQPELATRSTVEETAAALDRERNQIVVVEVVGTEESCRTERHHRIGRRTGVDLRHRRRRDGTYRRSRTEFDAAFVEIGFGDLRPARRIERFGRSRGELPGVGEADPCRIAGIGSYEIGLSEERIGHPGEVVAEKFVSFGMRIGYSGVRPFVSAEAYSLHSDSQ